MPLPRGCITGAEGCVLAVNAVGVGPPRKPIAISTRDGSVCAFSPAASGRLSDAAEENAHEFQSRLNALLINKLEDVVSNDSIPLLQKVPVHAGEWNHWV